ncbi:hypothetical protein D3C85_1276000 [compost metagenome]
MKFTICVFSRRWGHTDAYQLEHNSKGWKITFKTNEGQSSPDGKPVLYHHFDHDYINYPIGLSDMLEHVWNQISNNEISQADAQDRLQQLAEWVSNTERYKPKWPEYN